VSSENCGGEDRLVLAFDRGAGHHFRLLICHHHALKVFPFPLSNAQLLDEYVTTGETRQILFRASSICLCPLCCVNTTGALIHFPPMDEARRTKKKNP
jgi:hypothetical protein